MASAPLNWLLKIGGDTLNTVADTLSAAINELLSSKQDNLIFDDTPTEDSENPVTSDGIYNALDLKANSADLAAVATSGDYSDLENIPNDLMKTDGSNAANSVSFPGSFAHGVGANSYNLEATGEGAHAEGYSYDPISSGFIRATKQGAYAGGYAVDRGVIDATGIGASARGYLDGYTSHMYADGKGAHAEGYVEQGGTTRASGDGAHVEGYNYNGTLHAQGKGSHVEGAVQGGGKIQAPTMGAHAEGFAVSSNGIIAAQTSGAHAEGYAHDRSTIAGREGCHAEGISTQALGMAAHTEGNKTTARGDYAHAEGDGTTAAGNCSHVGGSSTATTDSGVCSFAHGSNLTVSRECAFGFGGARDKFYGTNIRGDEQAQAVFGFDACGAHYGEDKVINNAGYGCSGVIYANATINMNLMRGGMYLLVRAVHNISTGAIASYTNSTIIAHGLDTGTPVITNFGGSGTPGAVNMLADNRISIQNNTNNVLQFSLIRIL